MNPVLKVLIGVSLVVLITATLPILDLLEQFLVAVLVPIFFLVGLELIGVGTYETIRQFFSRDIRILKEKIAAYREELRQEMSSPA